MTIDLELGAEELRALIQPTTQAPAGDPTRRSTSAGNAGGSLHPGARLGLLLCASAAAVFVAIGSARVARQRPPAAVPLAIRGGGAIERHAPPPVTAPPVRFRNPFDKAEVFEFPAGTSRAEARTAVAKLLRERARERLALFAEKRTHRHRAAATVTAQNSARLSEEGNGLGAPCTLMKCVRSDAGRL